MVSFHSGFAYGCFQTWGFPGGSGVKNSPASAGEKGPILGLARSPSKGNGSVIQYSCLEILWTEEPGRLQYTGLQSVRHNWATEHPHMHTFRISPWNPLPTDFTIDNEIVYWHATKMRSIASKPRDDGLMDDIILIPNILTYCLMTVWLTTHTRMQAQSLQSCPTLCSSLDHSLPASPVHGLSRQEYWSGLPCPPPGDLHNPGIESMSPAFPTLKANSLLLSHQGSPTDHTYSLPKREKVILKFTWLPHMPGVIVSFPCVILFQALQQPYELGIIIPIFLSETTKAHSS